MTSGGVRKGLLSAAYQGSELPPEITAPAAAAVTVASRSSIPAPQGKAFALVTIDHAYTFE